MRLPAALAPILVLCLASPAWAQAEGGSKARLDEFQLSLDRADASVEQLEHRIGAGPPSPALTGDRVSDVPAAPQARSQPVPQLSPVREAAPTQQVAERDRRPSEAPGAVSSRTDSRPRSSAPLAGADRCDPQGARHRSAECSRILELRAAEFNALEAPRLSAEQALLAEHDGDSLFAPASRTTLILASKANPDAESLSNQALASIALSPTDARPDAQGGGDLGVPETMREALRGVQIDIPPPSQP